MMDYSFIVPVYNCRSYLENCVVCICALELDRCEVLLIDDGSTDGSGALCDVLAQNNKSVRVIHQPNKGASAARNRGLQEAAGNKILFVDADDSFDVALLRKVLSSPLCEQSDMVFFGLSFDYYQKGRRYRRDVLAFPYSGIMTSEMWGTDFTELFAKNALSPLWNKVFKRRILLENQLRLNEQLFLYEDLEFVLRYMQHCENIGSIPEAVYHYRQAEDEGNAGRRLARIPRVSDLVCVIETAMDGIRETNPAVDRKQADTVLQQLYLTLARGKTAVATLDEIRDICRDFRQWAADRELPLQERAFQNNLRKERVLRLYLSRKKSAARHWLAVRVKSFLYSIKSDWGM